jgi:hypothetical protein
MLATSYNHAAGRKPMLLSQAHPYFVVSAHAAINDLALSLPANEKTMVLRKISSCIRIRWK